MECWYEWDFVLVFENGIFLIGQFPIGFIYKNKDAVSSKNE